MLVVGEKEMEAGSASVRAKFKGDLGVMPIAQIIEQLKHEIDTIGVE
jgi:threonyl-tRNA synthetase